MARIATIQPKVTAAFRDDGGLNTCTPLEIASVPVMATHPSANPRISRNARANVVVGDRPPLPPSDAASVTSGADATMIAGPNRTRYTPKPMSPSIIAMNAYVGMLKAIPDSRTPRRFITIRNRIARTPSATVCVRSDGYADVIAAMPAETDVATVST